MNTIAIAHIIVNQRRRQIRTDWLPQLAESIKALGVLSPILVTPVQECSVQSEPQFVLVAGHHRLEGCRMLGMTEIPAIVVTMSEMDKKLAEIDENMIRAELTHLERADHFAARKELYEARFPETKRGIAQANAANQVMGRGDVTPIVGATSMGRDDVTPIVGATSMGRDDVTPIVGATSFVEATAQKLNTSTSTISASVRRSHNISPEIKEVISTMPAIADNTKELDALANMTTSEQKAAVQAVQSGKARSIRDAAKKEQQSKPSQPMTRMTKAPKPDGVEELISGQVDWEGRAKYAADELLVKEGHLLTSRREISKLRGRIKELESRPSEPVSSPASLMAELEEWKRRALEAEERCIYLGQQLDEINANPARQSDRGLALEAMLNDLQDNLEENSGEFYRETLDLFENRFTDLVFSIKEVRRKNAATKKNEEPKQQQVSSEPNDPFGLIRPDWAK